eukprot:gene5626-biopygen11763
MRREHFPFFPIRKHCNHWVVAPGLRENVEQIRTRVFDGGSQMRFNSTVDFDLGSGKTFVYLFCSSQAMMIHNNTIRTVARAWRGRGAGYRLQFGRVARAWRGHGVGVARAFPVPPGQEFHAPGQEFHANSRRNMV